MTVDRLERRLRTLLQRVAQRLSSAVSSLPFLHEREVPKRPVPVRVIDFRHPHLIRGGRHQSADRMRAR